VQDKVCIETGAVRGIGAAVGPELIVDGGYTAR